MDLETVIIGLLSVALFVVPIMFVQRKQKAKRLKLLQEFIGLAGQRQVNIDLHDSWDPYYTIGIDTVKKKLFYTLRNEGQEQQSFVDLAEVGACSVKNSNRDQNGEKIIDRIDLVLSSRNARQADRVLEFYNREVSLNFNNELMRAEKWKSIISSNLMATPTQNPTAPTYAEKH
ncbi:hypothetical protein ACMA1I_16080 [Pontibacter sp. 13R65]|uniref:hypothetical protein n=1 Tax=Pontibacter sp. 13R65 TaxID=3127458 RepID=UPI00301D285B